jgi:D-arabinose 1-dehydrogenase-like Zn-dependent alcohol dehydrogenase
MATMRVAAEPEVAPMRVAQIPKPCGDFEVVEREIPTPGAEQVRIKIQACGVCHSDVLTKEGLWPGMAWSHESGFLNRQNVGLIQDLRDFFDEMVSGVMVGVPDGI